MYFPWHDTFKEQKMSSLNSALHDVPFWRCRGLDVPSTFYVCTSMRKSSHTETSGCFPLYVQWFCRVDVRGRLRVCSLVPTVRCLARDLVAQGDFSPRSNIQRDLFANKKAFPVLTYPPACLFAAPTTKRSCSTNRECGYYIIVKM